MTPNSPINYPVYLSKRESFEPKDSYRPSVPLSVYREVVKELQVTQSQVESLELENLALSGQNQQLQENMEQLLHWAQQLQQIIDIINQQNSIILKEDLRKKNFNSSVTQAGDLRGIYPSSSQAQSYGIDIPPQASGQFSYPSREGVISPSQFSQFNFQGATRNKFRTPVNSWVLATGIFLIVVMSCTGAFLVVNLKLNSNNR